MADVVIDERLQMALSAEPTMATLLEQPPDAFRLPFRGSKTEQYIIVWPVIKREVLGSDTLWEVVRRSVMMPKELGYCEDVSGVEVVPRVRGSRDELERVVRVGVYSNMIEQFGKLEARHLCAHRVGEQEFAGWNYEPIAGVTCSWYIDPARFGMR